MCELNNLFENEVYDSETGQYVLFDVEIDADLYVHDPITNIDYITVPIYTQADIKEAQENIINKLPLGAKICEIKNSHDALRVDFKDNMSDCYVNGYLTIDTKCDANEFQQMVNWCKPLDYYRKPQNDGFFYHGKFIDAISLAKSQQEFASLGGDY